MSSTRITTLTLRFLRSSYSHSISFYFSFSVYNTLAVSNIHMILCRFIKWNKASDTYKNDNSGLIFSS